MNKHRGQIIEYTVRKNGYSISDLAREVNVNRRSIYNWFNQEHLKKENIFHVGQILRHDFSKEFPELFASDDFKSVTRINIHWPVNQSEIDGEEYKNKYLLLLEKYNSFLTNRL